jgi:membrane protein
MTPKMTGMTTAEVNPNDLPSTRQLLMHRARGAFSVLRHWLGILGRAGKRMSDEDGFMVAGHMSFTAILAIFPFLIFLASILSFIGSEEDLARIVDLMFETMPAEVAETLEPAVAEVVVGQHSGFLTLGILATLWAAANGVEAIRHAFNRAYRVEHLRPFWYRRLQNFVFVVVLALMVPLMSFLIVLAPLLWRALSVWVDLGFTFQLFFTVVRYGIAVLALFVTLMAMHRFLPNNGHRLTSILPGVILTVALFVIAGTGFSYYLAHFADYSVTYGSMASIVIALLFFYMTSVIVVLGAYVNASQQSTRRRLNQKVE